MLAFPEAISQYFTEIFLETRFKEVNGSEKINEDLGIDPQFLKNIKGL
jgi:hypothetical protein|tara:strand:- start:157 stop:300 length:144 start_codon:yes stop_codon:yes gene_type:complete